MAKSDDERRVCRTPNADGTTRIPIWKYDCVRAAILDAAKGDGIAFKDLKDAVAERLSAQEQDKLGSLGWHSTVVKLELEVAGEIARLPGKTPQWIIAC
jgi:hypothetical protein